VSWHPRARVFASNTTGISSTPTPLKSSSYTYRLGSALRKKL
jgi:hypothetical protein